jgi:hypothetical protein
MPVPPGQCHVFGDERLLTTALGAMLAAVRALIEDRGDGRKVSVALGPRREAATLAAVLPNPKRFKAAAPSPYVQRRRETIMAQMRALGGPGFLKQLDDAEPPR